MYRLLCHAAENQATSHADKERLPAMWRDLLRVFFNMPVHYLYGGSTASYAAHASADCVPVDASEAWPSGTKVSRADDAGVSRDRAALLGGVEQSQR